MNFDHEAVGACGYSGEGELLYEAEVACGVAGVYEDGEVCFLHGYADGAEIEGVAGGGFKGADAAFYEDDVLVALGHDVFGGHQPFFDGHGHAAFEEYGFVVFSDFAEEIKVLGVAGADLECVGVFVDEFYVAGVHDFGDDGEACFFAGVGEHLEAFFTEAGEVVGGCAWFECSAAEEACAGGFDGAGCLKEGVVLFNAAGAACDHYFVSTDDKIANFDAGAVG